MDIIFYVDGLKLCAECFSDELVYDERRDETHCSRCGLILKDHTFIPAWEFFTTDYNTLILMNAMDGSIISIQDMQ